MHSFELLLCVSMLHASMTPKAKLLPATDLQ